MKETGIIMSGDHPRKILDGTKTMSRRTWGLEKINEDPDNWGFLYSVGDFYYFKNREGLEVTIKCPYGQVGDRLVIKEAWATWYRYDNLKPSEIPQTATIYYLCDDLRGFAFVGRKRSARFMCNWISRARPEITELRAERLQEISGWDIENEGLPYNIARHDRRKEEYDTEIAYDWFKTVWDSLNAKCGYGWDKNNWVWPIGFKVVK